MLSWLGKPKTGADIDDLIARKKYSQAIEAMRALFQRRTPAAGERQRFAEVLILADRWPEAAPILLGLADEHVRFGFFDKARVVLQRIEHVEPDRPDVAGRLAEIAEREAVASAEEAAEREEPKGESTNNFGGGSWFDEEEPAAPAEEDFEEGFEPSEMAAEPLIDPVEHPVEPLIDPVEHPVEPEIDPAQPPVEPEIDPDPVDQALEATEILPDPGPAAVEVDLGSIAEIAASAIEEAVEPPADLARSSSANAPEDVRAGEETTSVLDLIRGLSRRAQQESTRSGRPVLAAAFFHGFEEALIRPLLPGLHRRYCAAGDVILTEGESGDSVFLVASGSVKVLVRSAHGYNFEVDRIPALGFFGEVAALSGRPREASVVAASPSSLLEIEKHALDALALCRPQARQLLEEACVERASSPAVAAVRSVPKDVAVERAAVALAAHFGESVRMRLRLADVMLKAGNPKDAVSILTGVAEDLDAAGRADQAIAVLKKIERITSRGVDELPLAPLATRADDPEGPAPRVAPAPPQEAFQGWLSNVLDH